MKRTIVKIIVSLIVVAAVAIATSAVVKHFRTPGQLDVVTAQAMDMSGMRPPIGSAPVALTKVRIGSLADTVTYTGSIQALNTQEIASRVAGTITALSVYPGDRVHAGQTVVRIDSAELRARTTEAQANARQADYAASAAWTTHHLHHQFALEQAGDTVSSAQQAVHDAQGAEAAANEDIAAANAAADGARANDTYWSTEIAREKKLLDAGAVSLSEYQSELSQAQAAHSAVDQADAKIRNAQAAYASATARTAKSQSDLTAAKSGERMAMADIKLSSQQAMKESSGAAAAHADADAAAIVQSYTELRAPASGVVVDRPQAPGSVVQPGTVIVRIAQIDKVRVQANVAVTDMGGIHVGSDELIAPQGAPPIHARVSAIFPAANDQSRTTVVEALIPNPGGKLLPGGYVSVTITRDIKQQRMLVPAASIVTSGDGSSVWIVRRGPAASGPVTQYECEKCHMRYSAADAKKNNFVDPMDGGRLVPYVDPTAPASSTGPWLAHRVPVTAGATDGATTEVSSPELLEGDRVVKSGMAGLSEGAQAIEAAWRGGAPVMAAKAKATGQQYRCDKCGMIYSAADAKKNGYKDPMDGGNLVAVTEAGK